MLDAFARNPPVLNNSVEFVNSPEFYDLSYVMPATYMYYLAVFHRTCNYTFIKDSDFAQIAEAMILSKNFSYYYEEMNRNAMVLNGVLENIVKRYYLLETPCISPGNHFNDQQHHPLTSDNLKSSHLLLVYGCIFATLCFVTELLLYSGYYCKVKPRV